MKKLSVLFPALWIILFSSNAEAEPQKYVIDGDHTHIIWQVKRFGFTNTFGSFATISGNLVLDEATPENSMVSAEISLSGLRSDLAQREDIVRGPHWLDAEKFPVITYTSTSVTILDDQDGKQRAKVEGIMTLKGISAPLEMIVMLNKIGGDPVSKKKAAGFAAHGSFMRGIFGINTAMGPIGAEVSFQIEALVVATD